MNWHYVEQGQKVGPVSDGQLDELVREGKIQQDTLVWCENMADWKPYRDARGKTTSANAGVSAGATAEGTPEAVCAECGGLFPIEETIRHGNVRICARCKPVFMQKLSEGAQIQTGELNYARILSRFAAAVLDGLILGGVNLGINLLAGVNAARNAGEPNSGLLALQFIVMGVNFAIGMSYEVIMIGKYGATLGKMACKIKVVTADGGRVSYARAFGRYFAKMLSAFTCMIGYIIAVFDNPQKRALHDHICNTRVVYK
jgi:uncharacterized RDD family membrane protein YckC